MIKKISWSPAPDIKRRLLLLIKIVPVEWVKLSRIICFRSEGAKTSAYARIWGLSKIWQQALTLEPAYILEVISEKFDRLTETERDKVLLHELTHIPKNFSGALLPHIRRGRRSFGRRVNELIYRYLKYSKGI